MDACRTDELLRQLARDRADQAREASELVEHILRDAPIRWVEQDRGERVASVLEIALPEHARDALREACHLLTGVDGWELDCDRLIGLLSLAVVRREPLWLARGSPPP